MLLTDTDDLSNDEMMKFYRLIIATGLNLSWYKSDHLTLNTRELSSVISETRRSLTIPPEYLLLCRAELMLTTVCEEQLMITSWCGSCYIVSPVKPLPVIFYYLNIKLICCNLIHVLEIVQI